MKRLAFALLLLLPAAAMADRSMFSKYTSVDEIDKKIAAIGENHGSRKKAILYSDKATLLYRSGQMPEAAAAFEQALTFNTTAALLRHIYLYMGKAYESHGRIDRAIEAYEEALIYDSKNWRRHRDLAGLYEQVKLYKKARDLYASARILSPREPSLWYVSARVDRKMGLYADAEPLIRKADELGHDEHVVAREKSLIEEGRGRFKEALNDWISGSGDSADPSDIARVIYLAVQAGDLPLARENLKRFKASGAPKDSVQLYENLIELGPSGPDSLLSFRGKYPEIEALVASFLNRERTP